MGMPSSDPTNTTISLQKPLPCRLGRKQTLVSHWGRENCKYLTGKDGTGSLNGMYRRQFIIRRHFPIQKWSCLLGLQKYCPNRESSRLNHFFSGVAEASPLPSIRQLLRIPTSEVESHEPLLGTQSLIKVFPYNTSDRFFITCSISRSSPLLFLNQP